MADKRFNWLEEEVAKRKYHNPSLSQQELDLFKTGMVKSYMINYAQRMIGAYMPIKEQLEKQIAEEKNLSSKLYLESQLEIFKARIDVYNEMIEMAKLLTEEKEN